MTISKINVRTVDRLTSKTRYKEEEGQDNTSNTERNEEDDIQDIAFFCNEDEEDEEDIDSDIEESDWNYSHSLLINQSNANSNRLVEARQSSNSPLVLDNNPESTTNNTLVENSNDQPSQNSTKADQLSWRSLNGFKTIIKLVTGSLLGGKSFADVYTGIEDTTDTEDK